MHELDANHNKHSVGHTFMRDNLDALTARVLHLILDFAITRGLRPGKEQCVVDVFLTGSSIPNSVKSMR